MEQDIYHSDSNVINREYINSILIEERLIGAVEPDTSCEIFGRKYTSPVMTPAFSHLKAFGEGRKSGMIEYAEAAAKSGILNWVGMVENEKFGDIAAVGADTVRIIKPYADKEKIMDQILYAKEAGAVAVGIDIDHTFGKDGRYDNVFGEGMTAQTVEDLERYIQAAGLPFILKGILSVHDAVCAQEMGVSGIVVSQHSGRLPYAVPALKVLPRIVEALGEDSRMTIFVDGGIALGSDVFKCIALGAHAASVGRVIMPDLEERGVQGVVDYVEKMRQELAFTMGFTGFARVEDIDSSVLWNL